MEDTGKDHQVASSGKSKLRYQLRSSMKSKDEKPSPKAALLSSATKRARPTPDVSKSMNVLDLSGKDKSAKPPRRQSISAKTSVTRGVKRIDSMTPISESRIKRSAISQARSDTPSSEVSKSGMSLLYNRISTASYWLSQIKLAETAAKHSISLGFFKLALEAECEPKQQMQNELKAYAHKHIWEEHGALVNELFGLYSITEKLEELKVSENASDVVQGSTKSSDDDVQSATSSIRSRNLQPKSLNSDVARAATTLGSVKKESVQNKTPVARPTRGYVARSSVTLKGTPANTASKNTEEIVNQKSGQEKTKINKQAAKTVNEEDNLGSVTENEEENMGSTIPVEEQTTVEVI